MSIEQNKGCWGWLMRNMRGSENDRDFSRGTLDGNARPSSPGLLPTIPEVENTSPDQAIEGIATDLLSGTLQNVGTGIATGVLKHILEKSLDEEDSKK